MPALTSLRFFAAFYVVLFHAFPWHKPDSVEAASASAAVRVWYVFCNHGFSAVGFFFALSGFILASNYPAQRGVAKPDFYRARFARVYPVYVLGLLVALPFLAVHTLRERSWGHAALECALAFTLLQAWVPAFWNAVNIPGWSLSVEAFFYATYPLITGPLTRAASTPLRAYGLLAVLYCAALIAPMLGSWAFGIGYSDGSALANVIRYSPPLSLPEFAFGIVLGHLRLRGFDAPEIVGRLFVPALLLLGLALATDVFPYLLLHNGVLLPLFAIIILRCARGEDIPRLLGHPWAQLLGEASYSLYVLHLLVWIYIKIVIERSGYDPAAPWVFPTYATIAICASLASFLLVEQPARQWLHPKPRRETPRPVKATDVAAR
jgi:peptidoglycan/LPS O-acetylase OafA/YrhL